jgi:hypothetical protein
LAGGHFQLPVPAICRPLEICMNNPPERQDDKKKNREKRTGAASGMRALIRDWLASVSIACQNGTTYAKWRPRGSRS